MRPYTFKDDDDRERIFPKFVKVFQRFIISPQYRVSLVKFPSRDNASYSFELTVMVLREALDDVFLSLFYKDFSDERCETYILSEFKGVETTTDGERKLITFKLNNRKTLNFEILEMKDIAEDVIAKCLEK